MFDFFDFINDTFFIWALIIGSLLTLGYIFMKQENKEREKER